MTTTLYRNGAIPLDALDPVPAANGQTAWLLPLVAASLAAVAEEVHDQHGWELLVTSAGDGFRSLERQERVFRERYRPQRTGGGRFGDVRWWDGVRYVRVTGAAAAVPGTSNHGLGITVDLTGLGGFNGSRYRQAAPILVRHGWSNSEGQSVGESWHWNYLRTAYPVADTNIAVPGFELGVPPGRLPDLLDALTRGTPMETRVRRADGLIVLADTGVGKFIRLDAAANEVLDVLHVPLPADLLAVDPHMLRRVRQVCIDVGVNGVGRIDNAD